MESLAKKHGVFRKSNLVEPPPKSPVSSDRPQAGSVRSIAKPRYLKVDKENGIVWRSESPRGTIMLEIPEKLVLMTKDGTLRKVASNFSGPISEGSTPVVLAKREEEVVGKDYLCVFELHGQVKAVVIDGEDICRARSVRKRWMPIGANFIYFGEDSFKVPWAKENRKEMVLNRKEVRKGRVGAKGQKVCNARDIVTAQ